MNPGIWRSGLAIFALAIAGCAKKAEEPPPVVVQKPAAPKPVTVEVVKTAERSRHFLAVSQQLELGGTLYGYAEVDGDVLKLAGTAKDVLQQVAKAQPAAEPWAKQDLAALLKTLGLDDIKAVGVSSVPDGTGFFRNRAFFYMPDGRHGLLAGLGGKPAPFVHLNLAPADADVYAETEVDLKAVYETVKKIVAQTKGEPASEQMDSALKAAGEKAALSFLDLIYGLKGQVTVVVKFDEEKNIPFPGGAVPKFSLLVAIDGVAAPIEASLTKEPTFTMTQEGTRKVFRLTKPSPLPDLQPVFATEGRTAYFATTSEFLDQCLTQKNGLAQTEVFRTAMAHVGEEGNGMTYVSPRFFRRLRQIESLNPNIPEQARSIVHLIATSLPAPDRPLVTVRTNLPDGILVRSYWNRSLKQDVAAISIYNPVTVGFLAAMAIPAFQKVRTASQEKAVLNNLRQFMAAGDQYCLENGVNSATYSDLVGPGRYIRQLVPVAGENYRALKYVQGEPLRVRLANGRVVEYAP